jgi:ribose transport system ATP-binding protein
MSNDGAVGTSNQHPALLETVLVSKRYGAQTALADVSLNVNIGEVVGLIGENGAGKSTLLDIVCGTTAADSGRLIVNGREVHPRTYREATELGIFRVFQNLSLVPSAAVFENLFLAHEGHFSTFGVLRRGRMRRQAAEVLERFGHASIDPTARTGSLDFATRQVIEIVKCFALADLLRVEQPLILLDEPTTGLTGEEVDFFTSVVDRVRTHAGIIFVSHRLGEIAKICDRAYVLRDGEVIGTRTRAELQADTTTVELLGRQRAAATDGGRQPSSDVGEAVMTVTGLGSHRLFADIHLQLRAGEIVGLAGVVGSGRSELLRALAGDLRTTSGTVTVAHAGRQDARPSIPRRIRERVGYVPPDRASEGLFIDASVTHNITVARLVRGLCGRPVLHLADEKFIAKEQAAALSIKAPSVNTQVRRLSGGNAQKVMLGRWLAADARLLLLDNPTAGIDVFAKRDIYDILQAFVDEGGAVLVASNELRELLAICDRIVFMRDGRITARRDIADNPEITEEDLLVHMV